MKSITVKYWHEVSKDYTGHVKFVNGNQYWYKNGKRHREDGPAVIYTNGTQYWYKNGKHHREDGPAIIYANGTQEWYLNDKKYSRENYYRELHKRGIITE